MCRDLLRRSLSLLGLAALLGPLPAQGVQPLAGTYRFVRPSFYFGGACGPGPVVYFEEGSLTAQSNGSFNLSSTTTEICTAGSSAGTSSNSNAAYTVGSDGTVFFDFDPSNPGTQTARLFVRPDGSVMLHTPDNLTDEGTLALAVRLSSGQSNASLHGTYHVVKVQFSNGAAGISSLTELGTLTFDGAGSCSGAVTRHTVTATGATSSAALSIAGNYVVAPDGQMQFLPSPASAPGAVSADGEIFFAADVSGPAFWLVVGVRMGTNHTAADQQGPWGLSNLNVVQGTGSALPDFSTDCSSLAIDSTGAFTGTDHWVDNMNGSPPVRTSAQVAASGSSQLLGADGRVSLQLLPAGRTVPPVDGAISSDGSFLLGHTTAAAVSSLVIGLRRPTWPANYGTATPGTGQIAPQLGTAGGFPYPGNGALALVVDHAVGGSFAMFCFANRRVADPGVALLGGTVWLDPARIFLWLGAMSSGSAGAPGVGAATLLLAPPPLPVLRGFRCFVQAAVFDAGGPQGFAFSPGLDLQLAR
jgi:hypothetical protein